MTKGVLTDMKCIYASKLYKSSKRKDAIIAALFSSSNSELVRQLASSLDEEYRQPDLVKPQSDSAQPAEQGGMEGGSSEGGSEGGGGGLPGSLSSGLGGGSFNPETDLMDFPEGEDDIAEGEFGEGVESEEPEEGGAADLEGPDTGVKEATQIKACTLDVNQLNVLKDSLNLAEGLAGVSRIMLKDTELWIYYNDDINLNNIMTDVIEYISQAYSYIEFNRLARSDNAIVFECNVATALSEVS